MFLLVPGSLLLYLFIVSLPPELAKLVELLYLRVLYLDDTVFALSYLLALLRILLRAVATATPCAVVAVVATSVQSVELTIAQLTIRLVLDGPNATISKSDGCYQGRV